MCGEVQGCPTCPCVHSFVLHELSLRAGGKREADSERLYQRAADVAPWHLNSFLRVRGVGSCSWHVYGGAYAVWRSITVICNINAHILLFSSVSAWIKSPPFFSSFGWKNQLNICKYVVGHQMWRGTIIYWIVVTRPVVVVWEASLCVCEYKQDGECNNSVQTGLIFCWKKECEFLWCLPAAEPSFPWITWSVL